MKLAAQNTNHPAHKKSVRLTALLVALLLLSGCNGVLFGDKPPLCDESYTRLPSAVSLPAYTGEKEVRRTEEDNDALIDLSSVTEGYVTAACNAPVGARLQVCKADKKQNYVLESNGEPQFFPLAMGSGAYTFKVFLNLQGDTYQEFLKSDAQVDLEDEFVPFLLPNVIVPYGEGSPVVTLAHELAKNAATDLEVVQQVHYWVSQNIAYDEDKAQRLANTPFTTMPDLEQVITEGRGICIDFAALTAALLRANGIPCKLEIGTVEVEDGQMVSHAWNSVWIAEEGRISTHLAAQPMAWNRIDLSLAGSGHRAYKTITEDSRYVLESVH